MPVQFRSTPPNFTMKIQLAGSVIPDAEGRILLIHRNTADLKHWELPGGKIETGETAQAAAKREVAEELGIEVEIVRGLGDTHFDDQNGSFHYTWFLAAIKEGQPIVQELHKFDECHHFTLEELQKLTLSANMTKLLPKLLNGDIVLLS